MKWTLCCLMLFSVLGCEYEEESVPQTKPTYPYTSQWNETLVQQNVDYLGTKHRLLSITRRYEDSSYDVVWDRFNDGKEYVTANIPWAMVRILERDPAETMGITIAARSWKPHPLMTRYPPEILPWSLLLEDKENLTYWMIGTVLYLSSAEIP